MFFGFQIIIGLPVALEVPSQPFAIVYRALTLALAIGLIFIMIIRRTKRVVNIAAVGLLGFWILYSIRAIYDIGFLNLNLLAYPSQSQFYYFSYIFGAGLIPVLAIVFSARHINFKKDSWMVLLFLGILIAVTIFIISTKSDFLQEHFLKFRLGVASDEGSVLNPITLGKFGVVAFYLGFAHLLSRSKKSILRVILYILFLVIGFAFIVLSGSRGPLIAFLLGLPLFLYYHFNERKKTGLLFTKWIVSLLIFYFLISFFVLSNINSDEVALLYRIQESTDDASTKVDPRVFAWKSAWNQFLEHPHVGDQMFEREFWQYPHNVVLESFMATGLLGGILFTLTYCYSILKLIALGRNRYAYTTVATFCLVALVSNLFSGGLYFNSELWATLAFLTGYNNSQL